jgi:hypothetical protein
MSEENMATNEQVKELVIARLDAMPSNYKLSIGSSGTFTIQQLIQSVKADDQVGKQVVAMQLNFIKALTSGKLIEALNKNG